MHTSMLPGVVVCMSSVSAGTCLVLAGIQLIDRLCPDPRAVATAKL